MTEYGLGPLFFFELLTSYCKESQLSGVSLVQYLSNTARYSCLAFKIRRIALVTMTHFRRVLYAAVQYCPQGRVQSRFISGQQPRLRSTLSLIILITNHTALKISVSARTAAFACAPNSTHPATPSPRTNHGATAHQASLFASHGDAHVIGDAEMRRVSHLSFCLHGIQPAVVHLRVSWHVHVCARGLCRGVDYASHESGDSVVCGGHL